MAPERWLPFFGVIFLIGALYEIPFLATFSATMAFLLAVTHWWRTRALDDVKYIRRPFYRRGFPGEKVALTLEVRNEKLLPLSWLRIEDPWPLAIGPENKDQLAPSHLPEQGLLTNVFNLRWFERSRRHYSLVFRKRGVYKVGPARLQSGDMFGLYEQSMEEEAAEYLTVFPEMASLEPFDLSAQDPFGDRRSRRRIFEDPNQPIGVRAYHPEDGFRRVHWPATARTGSLQVKVYQPTSARVSMVCLNASTFERHWEGYYPALLERLISVAARMVYHYVDHGHQVGLISNGCLAHSDRPFNIPPGRSPRQLGYLLEALAGVTPIVKVPFERFLLREMPRVHYGASLLIITAVSSPELFDTLRRLKRHGRTVTMLSLDTKPPEEIPGIVTLHIPFDEDHEPFESLREEQFDV
jgi:uncharacterized protein (DUF58 family)